MSLLISSVARRARITSAPTAGEGSGSATGASAFVLGAAASAVGGGGGGSDNAESIVLAQAPTAVLVWDFDFANDFANLAAIQAHPDYNAAAEKHITQITVTPGTGMRYDFPMIVRGTEYSITIGFTLPTTTRRMFVASDMTFDAHFHTTYRTRGYSKITGRSGTFQAGENLAFSPATPSQPRFRKMIAAHPVDGEAIIFSLDAGDFVNTGDTVTGVTSGATATIGSDSWYTSAEWPSHNADYKLIIGDGSAYRSVLEGRSNFKHGNFGTVVSANVPSTAGGLVKTAGNAHLLHDGLEHQYLMDFKSNSDSDPGTTDGRPQYWLDGAFVGAGPVGDSPFIYDAIRIGANTNPVDDMGLVWRRFRVWRVP